MGLSRYPASREGRLLLAQLYADNYRSDLAKELLANDLTYHPQDPAYARIVFAYLPNIQADAEVIKLADQIRQSPLMAGAWVNWLAWRQPRTVTNGLTMTRPKAT